MSRSHHLPTFRSLAACASLAMLSALPSLAHAASVSASYSLLSGNTWQASFNFSNGPADPTAFGLTVFFDPTNYANLSNPVAPANWDPLVTQPDALLGDGSFDVYALTPAAALQPGQTLGGYSVRFDFLGTGTPGRLDYEFYSLENGSFVSLQTGQTVTVTVPEPTTLWLGAAALVGLVGTSRRKVATPERVTEAA